MNRTRMLAGMLVLVAACAAGYFAFREKDASSPSRNEAVVADGEPIPDIAAIASMPKPMEASKWLAERTKRYRALFKDWQCDVLVVPVQVEAMAFDRPTRLLMSGDLARALSAEGTCVSDPFVVDTALGEGLRVYDPAAIASLGANLKAKMIVRAFAGHNKSNRMRVTLQVDRWAEGKHAFERASQKSFDGLAYSYTESPYAQFHDQLPAMLQAVGLRFTKSPVSKETLPDSMPASPKQVSEATGSPAAAAADLMLLAMLAPPFDSHAADVLFAKAYLALQDLGDDDATVRMRARALLHLSERPYALLAAAKLKGAEADGLRAVANGDLPGARAALGQVRDPWDYAFLSLETLDLEMRYKFHADALAKKIPDTFASGWQSLVAMRLTDNDSWSLPNPIPLKESLDATFPIKGASLKELTAAQFITGTFDPNDYAMLAARHVRLLLGDQPRIFCCSGFTIDVQPLDVLRLFEERAEKALVRYAAFYEGVQGKYDYAVKLLKDYDDIIGGRPDAEIVRAHAEWSLQERGTPKEIEDHKQNMHVAARIALAAEPGQEYTPSSALWYISQKPVEPYAHAIGDAYCDDFPIRAAWPGAPDTYEPRLQFSTVDIEPLKQLMGRVDAKRRETLLTELDHRFIGDPAATLLRLDNPKAGQTITVDDLKRAIAADNENWKLYERLAEMYLSDGRYRDASELAQSFPRSRKDPGITVDYANDIFDVGTPLYYAGAIEEARPLLKIAADYNNGSSASVRSQARLYLLDNQLSEAAITFLGNAQHYETRSDFRDFLILLFAGGESQDAWQGFDQLIAKFPGPQLWTAALVGHRRDNISDADLRAWLLGKSKTLAKRKGDDTLVNYALTERLVDRAAPPDDFANFIKTLAEPSGITAHPGKHVTFFGALGDERERTVGPGAFGATRQPASMDNSEIPSRAYLLAVAYTSLRKGEFDKASQQFDRLTQIYNTETVGGWGFVLPYFAFAAAQSGDKVGLEKYLDQHPVADYDWGGQLAMAVFDALHGKGPEAEKHLDFAFRRRPGSGSWPTITSYQYAETCIWLFEKTGDKRYKERALDWARKHVQIEPTYAWAYALIAHFGDTAKERAAMLAKALYLDPQSYWATTTPSDAQAIALASLKDSKPFNLQKPAAPERHL